MPRAEVPPVDEWSQAGFVQPIFQSKGGKPFVHCCFRWIFFGYDEL